jgi:hypothetical protein
MIKNSTILAWFDYILIIGVFLSFSMFLIIGVPLLFGKIGSTRPLMFLGMALSFLITNMAAMTRQYKWHESGELKVQLLVLVCIWLVSWILFNTNYQNLLYGLIAIFFLSNTIVQFENIDFSNAFSRQDQADNMLVNLVDSRKPVNTPNIYLLVYDSYVINETMLSHSIDNLDQQQYLEELGFTIYPHTYSIDNTSIPSMSRVLNASVNYYGLVQRAVSGDGIVQNLLEDFGYKTYGVFYSDYFFRGINPRYTYYYPAVNSPVNPLIKAIFLGEFRFKLNFEEVPLEDYIYEKRKVFSTGTDYPRFVYSHSQFPGHSTNDGVCRPNETELYKTRLNLANIEMREDLALIVENDPGAIVVIAGDHGPYLTKNCHYTRDEYDASEIDRLDIQDRNGTFLAIKWPTSDYHEYDEIIVLQDIFPSVFAYMFEDQEILLSKIEPITVNGSNLSGVEVSNGIIIGGVDNGEALFELEEGD